MAANILEHFFVKLSMKGPSATEQREAERGFSALGEAIALAVAPITAAATAVVFATDKIASGLSKLYFESQKTGATVREIAALGYAFEQNGSTLEKFHADFDKFAQTLRDFPEYKKLLRDKLQLKPEDFKDDLTLYSATLKALAAKRAAGDTQSEGAFRKLFGFDEDNIIARGRKEFDKFYEEGFERNKGIDENSVKALALVRSLNAFGAALEAVGRKAAAALFDKYGVVLDDITAWVDDHANAIVNALTTVVDQFVLAWGDIEPIAVPVVHKIGAGLDYVTAALDRLLGSPDGQHGGLHAVRYVLDALAIYIATKWAWKLLGLLGVRGALGIGGAFVGGLAEGLGAAGVAAVGAAGAGVGAIAETVKPQPLNEGEDEAYRQAHPGWVPGQPKDPNWNREAGAPPMPEPKVQEYIGKGGFGPFSHDQNVGAGQDFNIPGQGGFHPIGGKLKDWGGKGFDDFIGRITKEKQKPRPDEFITHPDIHYDRDPNMPAIQDDPAALKAEKLKSNKMQQHFDYGTFEKKIEAMLTRQSAPQNQWPRTNNIGTRKQVTNIQLASTDPHSAASEIARHMKAIHAGTLRSLDRLA